MSLSPQMLKLKLALKAAGVEAGGSYDSIVAAATDYIEARNAVDDGVRARESDSHSSGPQFDVPAKPKRTKKPT